MNWKQAGVWCWRPQDLDGERMATLMDLYGFGFVLVQIHNGLGHDDDAEQALTADWLRHFRGKGISIVGWGVLGDHPEREANYANERLHHFGLSAYVADAEGPHKGDWPGGDAHRSDVFCRVFRKLRPKAALGFTTFGAAPAPWVLGKVGDDSAGPMHFTPWWKAGAVLIPQAYPNEFGDVYEPKACVQHAIRANWPLSGVKLAVGNYNGWHAAEYVPRLKDAYHAGARRRCQGFTAYDAENMIDDDYRAYGDLIRLGLAEAA